MGDQGYLDTFGYVSDLYQSLFLQIREEGTHLIHHFVAEGDTVFDVGANIGRFTSLAAKLVGKQGRVHSFEPLAYPRGVCARAVRLKGLSQVTVVDAALSDREGAAEIIIPLRDGWKPKTALAHLGDWNDGPGPSRSEQVILQTMDSYCEKNGVKRLGFVKCDVEGAEMAVFAGGAKTLERFKPTLYCEVDPGLCERHGTEFTGVFRLLGDMGYRAWLPDDRDAFFVVDPAALDEKKREYFFVHEERRAGFPCLDGQPD